MSLPRIGIALGDVTGIGPEVTLKALAELSEKRLASHSMPSKSRRAKPLARAVVGLRHNRAPFPNTQSRGDAQYVIIGDARCLRDLARRYAPQLALDDYAPGNEPGVLSIYQPLPSALGKRLTQGGAEAARASYAWVQAGADLCLRGALDALVTAPVNKEAIVRAGIPFVGQTEMLSEQARASRTAMMLLGQDDRGRWLRVALATTHVPVKNVSDHLTREKILTTIELAAQACRDLSLPRARVAVCGLNPHAGEGGHIGTEEQATIAPAVKAAQRKGIDVLGPMSADALFYYAYRGDYDAVVAMYHDQGLAPLKMVAFEQGVNWTLGLPFIRTSPDHGTAYDIAGQGKANPSSMLAAIRLAKQLVRTAHERR
jgi:4-hydroxythreonine-4-phosphate dehydrogenase